MRIFSDTEKAQATVDFYKCPPDKRHERQSRYSRRQTIYRKHVKELSPEVLAIVQPILESRKMKKMYLTSVDLAKETMDYFSKKVSTSDASYNKLSMRKGKYRRDVALLSPEVLAIIKPLLLNKKAMVCSVEMAKETVAGFIEDVVPKKIKARLKYYRENVENLSPEVMEVISPLLTTVQKQQKGRELLKKD